MLYAKLATSNIELADKTHSQRGFKFYTFSNLILEDRIPEKTGWISGQLIFTYRPQTLSL
jgi:CRISPR-associated endoribonuclease Cas6